MKRTKPAKLMLALLASAGVALAGTPSKTHHTKAQAACGECHLGKEDAPVPYDTCVSCHKVSDLVERTSEKKPLNPHSSPHFAEVNCTVCHQEHGTKTVDFCATCHK